jgi:hypothetical protein
LVVLWPVRLLAQDSVTLRSVEATGGLQSAGIVAEVSGDENGNAGAILDARVPGAAWASRHSLVRVGSRFVGSLFWLTPGAPYEARVTIIDPDGVRGSPGTARFATWGPECDDVVQLGADSRGDVRFASGGERGHPLTIRGAPGTVVRSPITIDGANDVVLERLVFDGAGIRVRGASRVAIRDCRFENVATSIRIEDSREIDVSGVFVRGASVAFEIVGASTNVRLLRSRALDVGIGFSIDSEGPTWLIRDVVLSFDEAPVVTGPASGIVFAYHDTFASRRHASLAPDLGALVSRNTVWMGAEPTRSRDVDFDDVWNPDDPGALERLQRESGQERQGLAEDPLFVDLARGDVRLRRASPLVDRGVYFPGIDDDFSGRAPDVGAFERSDETPAPARATRRARTHPGCGCTAAPFVGLGLVGTSAVRRKFDRVW